MFEKYRFGKIPVERKPYKLTQAAHFLIEQRKQGTYGKYVIFNETLFDTSLIFTIKLLEHKTSTINAHSRTHDPVFSPFFLSQGDVFLVVFNQFDR